jgi:hypothetical protein
MGQAHLVAVGGAGVTDADGFYGATLRFCHINVLLPRVVYRGQPKNATAGVKALFLTQRRQDAKIARILLICFYNFAPLRLGVK